MQESEDSKGNLPDGLNARNSARLFEPLFSHLDMRPADMQRPAQTA